MTSNVKLRPLPEHRGIATDMFRRKEKVYSGPQLVDYALAHMEPLLAEIEELRAEVERLTERAQHAEDVAAGEHFRAERLAEALQWYVDNDDTNDRDEGNGFWIAGRDRARSLLREQERT